MKKRHKKEREDARCCWVCGKLGGDGYTNFLRWSGYNVPAGTMAYAHTKCAFSIMDRKLRRGICRAKNT